MRGVDARSEFNFGRYNLVSTRWSAIRACGETKPLAQAAREGFCRDYWYPIYAYCKRLGHQQADAEDITQDFFAHILKNDWIERADSSKGRFRSFLLASLDNFLRDRFAATQAQKRAGGYQHIPLDISDAENRYAQIGHLSETPAEVFDSEWAAAVVDLAWKRLEAGYADTGKDALFERLKAYLLCEGSAGDYQAAAEELGISLENVKINVHRLRKRYGALLQEEVSRTVEHHSDIKAEMLHIREAFAAKATAAA